MDFWCDDSIRVRIAGPDGPRDVVVDQPYALVGYSPRSEVVLEGSGVRKRALLLLATKIGVYAVNLDRQEAAHDEPGRWITGDEPIVVGPHELTVSLASGKRAARGTPGLVDARAALPIPVLHIFGEGLLKDRRRLRHPLCLVGRRPQCSLQLRGEKVSSYHAALYWQDHRLWCMDLMSVNGTVLNGEPVVCSEVKLNDRLEVGEFGLVYYRWSPRHTTPGSEHLPEEEEGAVWDSAPGEAPDASRIGSNAHVEEAQLREKLEGEFKERLAGERQHFEAAQSAWQSERIQLQAELDQIKGELQSLTAAQDAATERSASEIRQADQSEPVPEPHFETRLAQAEPVSVAQAAADSLDAKFESSGPLQPAVADSQSADTVSAEESSVDEMVAVAVKPTSRRRAQPRGELTSFVSGRLSDLEQAHRRRLWLIWGAAVASALAIAGVGLGLWAWIA